MIKINLLPEEKKKKKKFHFKGVQLNLRLMPTFVGVIVAVVAIHLIILLVGNINQAIYAMMSREWKRLEPDKEVVEALKKSNLEASNHVGAIEAIMARKILWYRKLNQLSDLVVPGIWYTKISIDKKIETREIQPQQGQKQPEQKPLVPKKGAGKPEKVRIEIPYLNIEGEVSAVYGGELAAIGKFIDALKKDEAFFGDFSNIELDSTELHTILESDAMKFRINCYLKEEYSNEPSKI